MQSIQGQLPLCPGAKSPPEHWTPITNALIDLDLTAHQFKLAVTLLSYKWYESSPIIPSIKTLAGRMRCSVRTVQYALRALERKGLFVVHYTFRPDGGQMSNNFEIGPVLAPLLAPAGAKASTPSREGLHPPVQVPAYKSPQRNQSNGTTKSQPGYGRPKADPSRYTGGPLAAFIHR